MSGGGIGRSSWDIDMMFSSGRPTVVHDDEEQGLKYWPNNKRSVLNQQTDRLWAVDIWEINKISDKCFELLISEKKDK